MNALLFGTTTRYLYSMPCGLKNILFNDTLQWVCAQISFIGRILPLVSIETGEVVGTVDEITLVDTQTQTYLKMRYCNPFEDLAEEILEATTNILQICKLPDKSIDKLKSKGYKEVGSEAEH